MIDLDDYMFSFDLKVPVNESFWPLLGFAIQVPMKNGATDRYFLYKMLPFGLNDAARVLTKLMRSPIKYWHAQWISGFSFSNSRVGFSKLCCMRADLMALGLLISEEKCSWGARKVLEWTGFVWDTAHFYLSVTDRKIEKAAALVSELVSSTGEVAIRQVAGLMGLLRSFYLAMGPRSWFQCRGLMTFITSHVQRLDWKGWTVLDVQCQTELGFWNDNLRSLNGACMRAEGTVKDLDVTDLVSDAGSMLVSVTEFRGGVEDESKSMQEPLAEDDLGESSMFRELRALKMVLKARGESLKG